MSQFEVGPVMYDMGPGRLMRATVTMVGTRRGGQTYYTIRPYYEDGTPMRPRNVSGASLRKATADKDT